MFRRATKNREFEHYVTFKFSIKFNKSNDLFKSRNLVEVKYIGRVAEL
jgi:hypothetical protein